MARMLGLMGLAGTTWGLVLVHVVYGIGFTTLYFRNYYAVFPTELVRAAQIDGAGFFQTQKFIERNILIQIPHADHSVQICKGHGILQLFTREDSIVLRTGQRRESELGLEAKPNRDIASRILIKVAVHIG